jgi:hypothetical protein
MMNYTFEMLFALIIVIPLQEIIDNIYQMLSRNPTCMSPIAA